jgi:hypothetical protein
MLNALYVLETGAGIAGQPYSPTVEHPLYGGDRALGGHLQRR